MSCYKPRLSERLLQYLENLLSPRERTEMESHIRSCSDCKEELDALQKNCRLMKTFSAHLKRASMGMGSSARETPVIFNRTSPACPPSNVLVLYAQKESFISPSERENIDNHLAGCATCRQAVEVLWSIEEDLSSVDAGSMLAGSPPATGGASLPSRLSEALSQARSTRNMEDVLDGDMGASHVKREARKTRTAPYVPSFWSDFRKITGIFTGSQGRWQHAVGFAMVLAILGVGILFSITKPGIFIPAGKPVASQKNQAANIPVPEKTVSVVLPAPMAASPSPEATATAAVRVAAVSPASPLMASGTAGAGKSPVPSKSSDKGRKELAVLPSATPDAGERDESDLKKSRERLARNEEKVPPSPVAVKSERKEPAEKKQTVKNAPAIHASRPPAPRSKISSPTPVPVMAAALQTRHLEKESKSFSVEPAPRAPRKMLPESSVESGPAKGAAEVGTAQNAAMDVSASSASSTSSVADYESLLEEELKRKIKQVLGEDKVAVRVEASKEAASQFVPAAGVKSKDGADGYSPARKRLPARSIRITVRAYKGVTEEQKVAIRKILSESGRYDETRGDILEFK
jgi:hypothetical protein